MPSNARDRITQLLESADTAATDGNFQKAFTTLKEALHLNADDQRVKDALAALQARDQTGDALALIQSYLKDGKDSDGQRALQTLEPGMLYPVMLSF